MGINKMKNRKGFTLIELVMVLVIIAILAAVSMPNLTNLSIVRLGQAGRKIKSDIRFAQSYSLTSRQRTRVAFDTGANNYTLYREQSPGSWVVITNTLTRQDFTAALGSGDFSGTSISAVNFVSSGYNLLFDAEGAPYGYNPSGGAATKMTNSGSVTVSGGASTQVISVNAQTGTVSVQ